MFDCFRILIPKYSRSFDFQSFNFHHLILKALCLQRNMKFKPFSNFPNSVPCNVKNYTVARFESDNITTFPIEIIPLPTGAQRTVFFPLSPRSAHRWGLCQKIRKELLFIGVGGGEVCAWHPFALRCPLLQVSTVKGLPG